MPRLRHFYSLISQSDPMDSDREFWWIPFWPKKRLSEKYMALTFKLYNFDWLIDLRQKLRRKFLGLVTLANFSNIVRKLWKWFFFFIHVTYDCNKNVFMVKFPFCYFCQLMLAINKHLSGKQIDLLISFIRKR